MTGTSCTSSLPISRVAGQGKLLTYRCGRIVGSSVWRVAITSSNVGTTSAGAICCHIGLPGGCWSLLHTAVQPQSDCTKSYPLLTEVKVWSILIGSTTV